LNRSGGLIDCSKLFVRDAHLLELSVDHRARMRGHIAGKGLPIRLQDRVESYSKIFLRCALYQPTLCGESFKFRPQFEFELFHLPMRFFHEPLERLANVGTSRRGRKQLCEMVDNLNQLDNSFDRIGFAFAHLPTLHAT